MPNPKEDFIKAQMAGINEANAGDHGIAASFSSIAIPNLLPGMFVKILGVGDYFEGTYMLQEVDTKIDSSGAEMTYDRLPVDFQLLMRHWMLLLGKKKYPKIQRWIIGLTKLLMKMFPQQKDEINGFFVS